MFEISVGVIVGCVDYSVSEAPSEIGATGDLLVELEDATVLYEPLAGGAGERRVREE